MDFRDRSIITQVAFKGAIDLAHDLDLTSPEGTAEFEAIFGFLVNSLFSQIGDPEEKAAQVIQAHFPGAVQVQGAPMGPAPTPAIMQPTVPYVPQNQPFQANVAVKGNQFGPLPDWLYQQAAEKGVTEVYDNRDRIAGTKRPWFKATTGGENAPAFWPPR
jgi:hypothetical protein